MKKLSYITPRMEIIAIHNESRLASMSLNSAEVGDGSQWSRRHGGNDLDDDWDGDE